MYKRAVKKGFEFSLMVVGESGLGKENIYLLVSPIWFSFTVKLCISPRKADIFFFRLSQGWLGTGYP